VGNGGLYGEGSTTPLHYSTASLDRRNKLKKADIVPVENGTSLGLEEVRNVQRRFDYDSAFVSASLPSVSVSACLPACLACHSFRLFVMLVALMF
jgi:hypothetical protein